MKTERTDAVLRPPVVRLHGWRAIECSPVAALLLQALLLSCSRDGPGRIQPDVAEPSTERRSEALQPKNAAEPVEAPADASADGSGTPAAEVGDVGEPAVAHVLPLGIHPGCVLELCRSTVDGAPVVLAVEIEGCSRSKRYGVTEVTAEADRVTLRDDLIPVLGEGSFSCRYVGELPGGVHVLQAWREGGKAADWTKVLLVRKEAVLFSGRFRGSSLLWCVGWHDVDHGTAVEIAANGDLVVTAGPDVDAGEAGSVAGSGRAIISKEVLASLRDARQAVSLEWRTLHPGCLEQLGTGIGGGLTEAVVDVEGCAKSAEYAGVECVHDDKFEIHWIPWTGGRMQSHLFAEKAVKLRYEHGYYVYEHLGTLANGINVLRTWANGGGSAIWTGLLFVRLEEVPFLQNGKWIRRQVVRFAGDHGLGDRSVQEVVLEDSKVIVWAPRKRGTREVIDLGEL